METAKQKIAFLAPDILYVYMIILQPFLGKRREEGNLREESKDWKRRSQHDSLEQGEQNGTIARQGKELY